MSSTFKTLHYDGALFDAILIFCYNKHLLTQKEPAMSKMNELTQDIQYLLGEGKSFAEVARALEIPVHFVVEAAQLIQEDCGPFATINS